MPYIYLHFLYFLMLWGKPIKWCKKKYRKLVSNWKIGDFGAFWSMFNTVRAGEESGTSHWRCLISHLCCRRCKKHNICDSVKTTKKKYGQPGLCAATQTQLHTRIYEKKKIFINTFENNFSLILGTSILLILPKTMFRRRWINDVQLKKLLVSEIYLFQGGIFIA